MQSPKHKRCALSTFTLTRHLTDYIYVMDIQKKQEYYLKVMIHHHRCSITLLTNVEPDTVFNDSYIQPYLLLFFKVLFLFTKFPLFSPL